MNAHPPRTMNLQLVVFAVVAAAFTTIYISQPVLPVLQAEFGADEFSVSLTISAVVLGIALANMPFGTLADRLPIHWLLLAGGMVVSLCCLVAAVTHDLQALIATRFVQGLFVPALTTCLAAYLARTLPADRLNVVMGSYVSATVAGGLGGRLLGGWLHPPAHWRYAFLTAGVLVLITVLIAAWRLREPAPAPHHSGNRRTVYQMMRQATLFRIFIVAFASFFVFSSVFNYLPFYLSGPPLAVATEYITALYLTYVIGIFMGPVAGALSNRLGNGLTMACGSMLFSAALMLSLWPSLAVVASALAGVCAGYFAVHAAAVGALNRKLESGRGRANALYVLFYYLGGSTGITVSGYAWTVGRWPAVVGTCLAMLFIPLVAGLIENRLDRSARLSTPD